MQNLKAKLKKLVVDTKTYVEHWITKEEQYGEIEVINFLNSNRHKIILSVLGFNNRFNQWEVSTGFNDPKSPVLEFVRQTKTPIIQKWLSEQFDNSLPKLSSGSKKRLRDYYEDQLVCALREGIRQRANLDAMELLHSSLGKELQEICECDLKEFLSSFKETEIKAVKEN